MAELPPSQYRLGSLSAAAKDSMPNPSNSDLVGEAKRLSDAATPGPWQIRDSEIWWISDMESNEVVDSVGPEDSSRVRADAEFITRARTLLLELAQQLEQADRRELRLVAELAWAFAQLRMWWRGHPRDTSDPAAAIAELDRVEAALTPDEGAESLPVESEEEG